MDWVIACMVPLYKGKGDVHECSNFRGSIKGLPETWAYGSEFTCDHAMICKKGGFISLRHNDLRDITYELLSEVCKGVENEPMLQPLTGKL